jgi:Domain of unknown function (DUF6946)
MSKIYIPTERADEWRRLLADPDKQWRTGYSAKTLAHCWQSADGLPSEIASILRPYGRDLKLLFATPEHKVPLPGASIGESQNDIFALVRAGERTFAITIEGKVREPFGETIRDWLRNASDGKRERLSSICRLLDIPHPPPDHIYYQLMHRTASAFIEAQRFKTDAAAMIVHSFSPERAGFEAYVQFASLFRAHGKPDELFAVRPRATPPLYIGWASGDPSFLTA